MCAKLDVKFTDSRYGEDYLTGGYWTFVTIWTPFGLPSVVPVWIPLPEPAKYAWYSIGGTSGYLGADGCSPTLWVTTGDYPVMIATTLKRDTTTYDVREVRPKNPDSLSCEPFTRRNNNECEVLASFYQYMTVTPGLINSVQTLNLTGGADSPTFRVAAVAGQVLSHPDSGVKANDTYKVYSNTGCPSLACSTHPVGQKQPNPFGLFDMSGNVDEWVFDHYDGTGYGQGPRFDPGGTYVPSSNRVLRGGNAAASSIFSRASYRIENEWKLISPAIGLRVARTLP